MEGQVLNLIQIINHLPYKDGYAYQVFAKMMNGKKEYIWLNGNKMAKFQEQIDKYWKENPELHVDEESNTSPITFEYKPKFVIKEPISNFHVETKPKGSPPKSFIDGGVPKRIDSFNKEKRQFLVTFADSPSSVVVPYEILCELYPDLVIDFFINEQAKE